MKHCPGFVYTQNQREHLAKTLPNTKNLLWCKENNYVIMPAPPESISLLTIQAKVKVEYFPPRPNEPQYAWYEDEGFFSNDRTDQGTWFALHKEYDTECNPKNLE